MPVTAKLSRKFYERFGDELTNELVEWFNQVDATYQGQLKELNERNFARFESKLDQRVAELRAEIQTGLARLEGGLLARIGVAEGRLARLTLWGWAGIVAALIALSKR